MIQQYHTLYPLEDTAAAAERLSPALGVRTQVGRATVLPSDMADCRKVTEEEEEGRRQAAAFLTKRCPRLQSAEELQAMSFFGWSRAGAPLRLQALSGAPYPGVNLA